MIGIQRWVCGRVAPSSFSECRGGRLVVRLCLLKLTLRPVQQAVRVVHVPPVARQSGGDAELVSVRLPIARSISRRSSSTAGCWVLRSRTNSTPCTRPIPQTSLKRRCFFRSSSGRSLGYRPANLAFPHGALTRAGQSWPLPCGRNAGVRRLWRWSNPTCV